MTHPLDAISEKFDSDTYWSNDKIELVHFHRASAAGLQLRLVIEQWEDVMDSSRDAIEVIEEFDKRLKAMQQENN